MPSHRSRRAFLAAGVGTLASLAGCLGSDSVLIAPKSYHSPPMSDGELHRYEPERTVEKLDVGDPDAIANDPDTQPHSVGIWNVGEAERRIRVELRDVDSNEQIFAETVEFPADAELSFRLYEPATYVLRLHVPATGVRETLQIPRETFDCNESSTSVGVFGYEIRSTTYSQLLACESGVTTGNTTESN
ncbi:hypothetical protein [Halorussus halophilus]|uniref:hypothetical protein n=1 Tax=Halorussus halophilus TaxID=2650975 RepID=UPI001300F76F|nr:hypothetical protein [Halorussus halophilus]